MQKQHIESMHAKQARFFDAFPGCGVKVSTVDGFQGEEADAVVFSATRNNPQRRIGFVADARRLNVAITRPRRGLVIIGSPSTLSSDTNWGQCASSPQSSRILSSTFVSTRSSMHKKEGACVSAL